MKFLSALLALLLVTPVLGQQVEVSTQYAVTGLLHTKQVGDLLLVDKESKPQMIPVGLVKVTTEASNIVVKASDGQRNPVQVNKVDLNNYVITQQGDVWIRVVCIDFQKNIYYDEETKVTLGGPVPPPTPPPGPGPDPKPPTPQPDIPGDQFDNLGQRVSQWSANLPKKAETGAVFKKWAEQCAINQQMSIGDIQLALLTDRTNALGSDLTTWKSFFDLLQKDLSGRWPLSKNELGAYYACIARGLGVK